MTLDKSSECEKGIKIEFNENGRKNFLRQQCEKSALHSKTEDLKGEMDQSEPSNSKKSLKQLIEEMKQDFKYKADKFHGDRKKEIDKHYNENKDYDKYKKLDSLSAAIQRQDHHLADLYSKIEQLRHSEYSYIRDAFHQYNMDKIINAYKIRRKLKLKEYQKMLQENRRSGH